MHWMIESAQLIQCNRWLLGSCVKPSRRSAMLVTLLKTMGLQRSNRVCWRREWLKKSQKLRVRFWMWHSRQAIMRLHELNSGPEVNIRLVNQRYSVSSFIRSFNHWLYSPYVLGNDGRGAVVNNLLKYCSCSRRWSYTVLSSRRSQAKQNKVAKQSMVQQGNIIHL